jgi:hypothetical protein
MQPAQQQRAVLQQRRCTTGALADATAVAEAKAAGIFHNLASAV